MPGALYAALFETIGSVAYPPPMFTLVLMLTTSSIRGKAIGTLVGALLQVVLFAAFSSYLLSQRVWRRRLTIWTPLFVALAAATWIQLSFASEAWQRRDYPGSRSSVIIGFVVLFTLFSVAALGTGRPPRVATRLAILVNCALHCAVVAVLFPYVGELP